MKVLPKNIFVTGIDTNVGKTVVSAILAEALQADYWKPVQSGNIEGTDAATIHSLLSNTKTKIHPEAYNFKAPTVPSYAAEMEGETMDMQYIVSKLPDVPNRLIVEGAGGLMVHLRRDFMVVDLIGLLKMPVVLVSKNYLGSINHTLLSIEAMKTRGIEIIGIIYNGDRSEHMRELVWQSTGVPEIGNVEAGEQLTKEFIREQAALLYSSLQKNFVI